MTQELGRPRQSGLSHLGLSVTDLDRTVAWYRDVLGAVVAREPYAGDRPSFSGRMAVLQIGPHILDLYQHAANGGETFGPARTGLDHFAFRADSYADLEQWARWLDTKGVKRSEIREVTGGLGGLFDFVDPDGLQIEFLFLDTAKIASMRAGSVRTGT
jgi:glyoxylase I family protein